MVKLRDKMVNATAGYQTRNGWEISWALTKHFFFILSNTLYVYHFQNRNTRKLHKLAKRSHDKWKTTIRIVAHFYLQTLECIQIIGICIQLKLLTTRLPHPVQPSLLQCLPNKNNKKTVKTLYQLCGCSKLIIFLKELKKIMLRINRSI